MGDLPLYIESRVPRVAAEGWFPLLYFSVTLNHLSLRNNVVYQTYETLVLISSSRRVIARSWTSLERRSIKSRPIIIDFDLILNVDNTPKHVPDPADFGIFLSGFDSDCLTGPAAILSGFGSSWIFQKFTPESCSREFGKWMLFQSNLK